MFKFAIVAILPSFRGFQPYSIRNDGRGAHAAHSEQYESASSFQ
jgi:hypothetical protein